MPSIYDEIGGAPAVRAAVDDLYARILADDAVRGYFADTNMARQRAHLRAFVSQALGGPRRYAGRELRSAHAPFAVTDEAFDQVVGHLAAALAGLGVPPEAIGSIASALAPLRAEIVTA
jgi:hemoglobin